MAAHAIKNFTVPRAKQTTWFSVIWKSEQYFFRQFICPNHWICCQSRQIRDSCAVPRAMGNYTATNGFCKCKNCWILRVPQITGKHGISRVNIAFHANFTGTSRYFTRTMLRIFIRYRINKQKYCKTPCHTRDPPFCQLPHQYVQAHSQRSHSHCMSRPVQGQDYGGKKHGLYEYTTYYIDRSDREILSVSQDLYANHVF